MFVPFGLRLEDDDTFVRQATGMNFLTPDDGVELGARAREMVGAGRRHRRARPAPTTS